MGAGRMDVDVAVLGGGTSGANAALQLARAGFSVALLDRRAPGKGGARWCNGIVPWQFERAGVDPPVAPELRNKGGPTHMLSPSGAHRFVVDNPVWDVDMRLLGERLHAAGAAAGVQQVYGLEGLRARIVGDRPVEVVGNRDGDEVRVAADLFVDATGRKGWLRSQVRALDRWAPPVGEWDLCSAQQFVFAVADRDGARRWLDAQGAAAGEGVGRIGVSGGFSTVSIVVEHDLDEVWVLCGTLAADGRHGTAPDLMRRIRAENPWIGERRFGGGALIPLRRPYDRLTAPGLALVGDAACQVMPAHGSGIGHGLMAGKILAESVTGAAEPGAPDVLWRYQAAYAREVGPTAGSYDAIRRMSVALGTDGVERLFAAGLMGPDLARPGLDQRLAELAFSDLRARAASLGTDRGLARTVLPWLARAGAAPALYRAFPRNPSERGLRAWSATARSVLGN